MLIEGEVVPLGVAGGDTVYRSALIGPHAVIHAVEVLHQHLGCERGNALLADAHVTAIPSGHHMIPESTALRLHQKLAQREPRLSGQIAVEAAILTADYIIANRIPRAVVWLLPKLPASLAARQLMNAIKRHSWTFIGAGQFEADGAWAFTIDRRQAEDPFVLPDTLFQWYAAVFQRLYRRLVDPRCVCRPSRRISAGASICHYKIERNLAI